MHPKSITAINVQRCCEPPICMLIGFGLIKEGKNAGTSVQTMFVDMNTRQTNGQVLHTQTHPHAVPVSKGRSPAKKNGFGFGLWLIKQTEEGVMLHTALPEDLALITTSHQELKCVLMRNLSDGQTEVHTDKAFQHKPT